MLRYQKLMERFTVTGLRRNRIESSRMMLIQQHSKWMEKQQEILPTACHHRCFSTDQIDEYNRSFTQDNIPLARLFEYIRHRKKRGHHVTAEEDRMDSIYRRRINGRQPLTNMEKKLYQQLSKIREDDAQSLARLRITFQKLELYHHAMQVEAKIAELEGLSPLDRARSYQRTGHLAHEKRQYKLAQGWYTKAEMVCRDHFVDLAHERWNKGEHMEAMDRFETALSQCPDKVDSIEILESMGDLLMDMGRKGEALTKYELALRRSEAFAKSVLQKKQFAPRHLGLVEDIGKRITRLKGLLKPETEEESRAVDAAATAAAEQDESGTSPAASAPAEEYDSEDAKQDETDAEDESDAEGESDAIEQDESAAAAAPVEEDESDAPIEEDESDADAAASASAEEDENDAARAEEENNHEKSDTKAMS